MKSTTLEKLVERDDLRDRPRVFTDRDDAGRAVAEMLPDDDLCDGLVLAVPAGGIPVAAPVAEVCGLPLDVAVVSKITLPWNPEAGYGAVAFDGTVVLNEDLVRHLGLGEEEVERGIEATRRKVARRRQVLRGDSPMPDLSGTTGILVDDGLASGFTMRCTLEALGRHGVSRSIVAVPTAHEESLDRIADLADAIYCPNVRSGMPFAVADAYVRWYDVSEEEAARLLAAHLAGGGP
ncbi:MAG: phosphoribosyltransferase family protein [Phycisphaerae bacterium]